MFRFDRVLRLTQSVLFRSNNQSIKHHHQISSSSLKSFGRKSPALSLSNPLTFRRFLVATLSPLLLNSPKLSSEIRLRLQSQTIRLIRHWGSVCLHPLEPDQLTELYRRLGKYVTGEGTLPLETLQDLTDSQFLTFIEENRLRGWDDPSQQTSESMEWKQQTRQNQSILSSSFHSSSSPLVISPLLISSLLDSCDFFKNSPNIHRVIFDETQLNFPTKEAEAHARDSLVVFGKKSQISLLDDLRDDFRITAYAIDSETTNEVDDAIAVHWVKPLRNNHSSSLSHTTSSSLTRFTVVVADATSVCPIDSPLSFLTARSLFTSTYLPEAVYNMLPKTIIHAATLSSQKAWIRTFNISFTVDSEGELSDWSVRMGWTERIKRLTYDTVQRIYNGEETSSSVTREDKDALWAMLRVARCRQERRNRLKTKERYKSRVEEEEESQVERSVERQQRDHQPSQSCQPSPSLLSTVLDGGLPEPLIHFSSNHRHVSDVFDQIWNCSDARLAVAELMIAANEICSKWSNVHHVLIPFRGSRPLSTQHEASLLLPTEFNTKCNQNQSSSSDTSTVVAHGIRSWTSTSSTHRSRSWASCLASAITQSSQELRGITRALYSPIPLYHNGLYTNEYCHSTSPLRRFPDMLVHHQIKAKLTEEGRGSQRLVERLRDESELNQLCSKASNAQTRSKMLQLKSTRFWILSFLNDALKNCQKHQSHPLLPKGQEESNRIRLDCLVCSSWEINASPWGTSSPFRFVSDIFIPRIQLNHSIRHSHETWATPGTWLICQVKEVHPQCNILILEIEGMKNDEEET